MSKVTLLTSCSHNNSCQYEHAHFPGPSSLSSMPCATTPISPRRRPTRPLRSPRRHQNAHRDNHSHKPDYKQLFDPQLHRRQQQHGRHIPQLLGHAGDDPMDVQLELHDHDMPAWGDMVNVFPATSIRQRRIRLFDIRQSELFGAAAWGTGHGCACFLRGL